MARLERARFLPHLIVLAAILGTYGFLSLPRNLRGNPDGPIPLVLPEALGPYTGEDLLFCQNDQCGRVFRISELPPPEDPGAPRVCPTCTNALASISIGETKMLPKGTPIFRKVYRAVDRPDIQTTLVFSGSERMSIHKPQVCLVSQGNQIVNEYEYDVAVSETHRMPVRVIEMVQRHADAQGRQVTSYAIYAYWFFNPERETTRHAERLFWMAYDNGLRNYRPRWAYVSLAMAVDPGRPEAFKAVLDDFVPRLYPITERLRADLRTLEGARARD